MLPNYMILYEDIISSALCKGSSNRTNKYSIVQVSIATLLNPNHPAEPINIQDLKRKDVKHVPKLQRTITPNDPIMKVLMFVFSCHCFKGCKGRCVFFLGMVIYVVVPKKISETWGKELDA